MSDSAATLQRYERSIAPAASGSTNVAAISRRSWWSRPPARKRQLTSTKLEQFILRTESPMAARHPATKLAAFESPQQFNATRQLEEEYQKLGWTKGPLANEAAQTAVRNYWVALGERGAQWLIQRARRESHIEILSAIADILAEFGSGSAKLIAKELATGNCPMNQVSTLLKALGWVKIRKRPMLLHRLTVLIREQLAHSEVEVRESAAVATRCLPTSIARELLYAALAVEPNRFVREAIEEEISGRP